MEYRGTDFFERRRMVLKPQMKNMRIRCERLYNYHSYCLFDKTYAEYCKECDPDVECVNSANDDCEIAEKFCTFLEGTVWDGDKEYLELYKAEAFYLMGSVYKERGSYDYALDYLLKAKKIIEKQSFQYVRPEEYARTCMYIGKCYLEKHYDKSEIREYYKLAKDVLTDEKSTEYQDSESKQKTLVELALLQAITEMDIYGQSKEIEWGIAWRCLKDAEGYEELQATENWKEKQRDTFWTTKGIWYREFYLKLQDETKFLFLKETLPEHSETFGKEEYGKLEEFMDVLPEEAFDQKIERLPERVGTPEQIFLEFRKWAKEMKLFGFKKAFLYLAQGVVKDPKNTICMGNMAAMLYHVENDDKSMRQDVETFLCGFKDEFGAELLIGKNKVIFGGGEKGIKGSVKQLLDVILEIEHNNMYALNLKAAVDESVQNKSDYYPILRTSTLKKRFRRMDELLYEDINHISLQEIKIHLICLHSEIVDYMNEAIVDTTEERWKTYGVGHYTRTEVIPKLINKESNSKFRLQNVNHLNDPLEGVLLLDYLKNAKPAVSGQGAVSDDRNENWPEQEKSLSGEKLSLIEEIMDLYDPKKNGSARSSVYMGSFSCRTDDLNMWSRYGDEGKGCCIEVDAMDSFDISTPSLITEMISDEGYENNQLNDIKYPLYMVLYLPENFTDTDLEYLEEYTERRRKAEILPEERYWWRKQKKLVGKFKELSVKLKSRLDKIQESCENILGSGYDEVKMEIRNTIMVILDLVRFLIKSDFYRDEREYRVIQYSSSPLYDQVDSGIPKLYINMDKPLVYKKICYGPCVSDFGSEATYVLNIKKEIKPYKTWELKVCQSRISYRGKGASGSK